ncbi:protein Peter pan [Palaemon carinicauda]|uniref:protein Peter pan n=1 Tax=Palaemon carinicauda TaxID=392227 RepID=UPI0035B64837
MAKKKPHSKNNRILQRRKDKAKAINESVKEPHCLVLTRGSVSMDLKRLSHDFQWMMEPNVPARLKGTKKNVIKDFVAVSAQLNLTHLVAFTQTSLGMYVKLCRIPRGPTVTFKIMNYTRAKDVLSLLKKQFTHGDRFLYSPCIMTNIQPNEGDLHLQVTARMFLDMFPNITPDSASPDKIRRCCLFNYDEEKEQFDLRHYAIRTVPVEVSKSVKKLMGRKVPNLGKFTDVSEFITKAGMLSDSEVEDDPKARVTVPDKKSKVALKSSVRLSELGPRMTLQVYKVESGLLEGQVLYHSHVIKSAEEKLILEENIRKKKKLKEKRRKQQEANIEEKKKKKEDHKKKCIAGMGMNKKEVKEGGDHSKGEEADDEDEDDDADYFRKEVGEEPDPDFFSKKRKRVGKPGFPAKKIKRDFKDIKKAQKERKKKQKFE